MNQTLSAKDLPVELKDCVYLLQSARQQVEAAKRSAAFWADSMLCRGLLSKELHVVAASLIETGRLPEGCSVQPPHLPPA